MLKKQSFWALVKKEFFTYINSAQAYVVIVPFILLSHFLYFRTALLLGDANMRPFIEMLPWFLIVLAPAITMRLFADEYRKETLELLFAHPLSEWAIVLSKFLGVLSFYAVILLATSAIPLTLLTFSSADPGLILSQYLGALFIGSGFLAVGMVASIFLRQSVGAFLVGAALNFGLMLLGLQFVILMFPGFLGRLVNEVAVMTHLTNLSRGVIDVRDLLYFLTLTGLALAVGVYKLAERKLAESPTEKRLQLIIISLIAGIGLAGNVFMAAYPIRLDLTRSRQFSLASGTKDLLKNLPDRVLVTLYTSRNLPGPMQVTLRETGDWLKDFSRYGQRLTFKIVYTDNNSAIQSEAIQKGIKEVQFNQIGSQSFAVQTGFLGLEVRFGEKTETIPFIEDATNLKYQLSRLILKLTREQKNKLGLMNLSENSAISDLTSVINDQYELVNLSNEATDKDVAGLKAILVFDDGTAKNASAAALLRQFAQNNGNLLLLVDGVNINQQALFGSVSPSDVLSSLAEWGVTVNPDLAFDLQLNEAIALPVGNMRVIVSYPFWVRSIVKPETALFGQQSNSVLLGWPSTLSLTSKEGLVIQPLLTTGQSGGKQEKEFTINPNQPKDFEKLTPLNQGNLPLGAVIEKGEQRLVVIGDSNWVTDEFLKNSPDNQTFINNLTDWVAADPVLASIPKRANARNIFVFASPVQAQLVQYLALFFPPLLTTALGFWWLRRRKKLTQRVYPLPG